MKTISKERDNNCVAYPFVLSLTVIILLVATAFIPPLNLFGLELPRRSILSQITKISENESGAGFQANIPIDSSANLPVTDTIEIVPKRSYSDTTELKTTSWTTNSYAHWQEQPMPAKGKRPNTQREDRFTDTSEEVVIESADSTLANFFVALNGRETLSRPVRIAVMGDSFIEGDIFTADLREILQKRYGGSGVGYVSFASPIAGFRATVGHTFEGFTTYNLANSANAKSEMSKYFTVAGLFVTAQEQAQATFKGVSFRDNLRYYPKAKILFINQKNSTITVGINDTLQQIFTPDPSANLQEININSLIENMSVSVSNADGFIGYGVEMESDMGVTVDNYSIRGSSGIQLTRTNAKINSQLNRLLPYDLIILQYGLNAMSPQVTNYTNYSNQLIRVVAFVKSCFPDASIMIMGVGDRAQNVNGEMVSMAVVEKMAQAQRRAARESGVAFWNTYEAMGGKNSMITFVKNNFASKDYTHIRYEGGRVIARRLAQSLEDAATRWAERNIVRKDSFTTLSTPALVLPDRLGGFKLDSLR